LTVAERWWTAYCQAAAKASVDPPRDPVLVEKLKRVWALSDFIARSCQRDPDMLQDLIASGDLARCYPADCFAGKVSGVLQPLSDRLAKGVARGSSEMADDPLETLQRCLRRLRTRELIRIGCRDILGVADLDETLKDLSGFADACIDQSLRLLYAWQCGKDGVPRSRQGTPQQLVVLGLGKLGGRELNFSSDIDLVLAYPSSGKTDAPSDPVGNDVFFTRLGRRLIKALGEPTADGIVFRVDVRLRPDGDNGPLVMSFDNMENYYQSQGREWERYAWIKARVVAGDDREGRHLLERLQPFVYRRYLDYGVFKALRDMKQKIALEVKRKGLRHNIKLGSGGIREIEFFGQVFQLLRGGVAPELRVRPIRRILRTLAQQGFIENTVAERLLAAYGFLRQTEHRLQEFNDQQTHVLPTASLACSRLAAGMEYEDWDAFEKQL
jgi:glutamate-ammonia-ligase adenylyltransferase